jgi:hypothetical protein
LQGRSAIYVRLLGDREAVDALTPTPDHIVIDRCDQDRANAEATRLLSKRVPVVAFVNDHVAGFSPQTLRQLAEMRAGSRCIVGAASPPVISSARSSTRS